MAREHAVSEKDRNEALMEAMLLAATADGKISQRELQALIARVLDRHEFEGTKPQDLNRLVESAAAKLASAKDLDAVFASLRARLPHHNDRMLAFGLASAVALADQRATRQELGLLKNFQAALGISETEVADIIDAIERGASLTEVLGEPVERLYAEVMVLVSAADGQLHEPELRALVESFAKDPAFSGISAMVAQSFVNDAVAAIASEGLPKRLAALAAGLSTHAQRLKAFRLAMKVAKAGDSISRPERKVLGMLQATFGLADDEVERIRASSA